MRTIRIEDDATKGHLLEMCRLAYRHAHPDRTLCQRVQAFAQNLHDCHPPCSVALPEGEVKGELLAEICHRAQLAMEAILYHAIQ